MHGIVSYLAMTVKSCDSNHDVSVNVKLPVVFIVIWAREGAKAQRRRIITMAMRHI